MAQPRVIITADRLIDVVKGLPAHAMFGLLSPFMAAEMDAQDAFDKLADLMRASPDDGLGRDNAISGIEDLRSAWWKMSTIERKRIREELPMKLATYSAGRTRLDNG